MSFSFDFVMWWGFMTDSLSVSLSVSNALSIYLSHILISFHRLTLQEPRVPNLGGWQWDPSHCPLLVSMPRCCLLSSLSSTCCFFKVALVRKSSIICTDLSFSLSHIHRHDRRLVSEENEVDKATRLFDQYDEGHNGFITVSMMNVTKQTKKKCIILPFD